MQRELLVSLAVQSYFEFIVLSLVFFPRHLNKGKARALRGWQLTAPALASPVNSIRRVAAGPRKAVLIPESFERCGVFFLFGKLAEVRQRRKPPTSSTVFVEIGPDTV